MTCIGTETLLAFAADRSPDRLVRFEAHLDGCAECRQLLGELAELSWMRVARTHDEQTTDREPGRAPLPTGRVVDRYIIVDVLGYGGMGVVYTAYDPRLERKIALKLLRPDRDGDARLLREAQTLARLRHPNVVAVHDAGTVDGQMYIAMELVEGTTLREWLKEPRDWRAIVALFLQAADGLAAAHAAGIVHRDFKPDNVLIGRDGRAQVADFGIATTEQIGGVAGTPAYMAPEQRRGEPATAASDQYSFCVALHEALLGYRPGGTPGTPRRVPARVLAAIERGLSEQRWPTMDALARALRRRSPVPYALAGAAAIACVGLAAFGALRTAHGDTAPTCSDAPAALAGIWDDGVRGELARRFAGAGGDAVFATLAPRVDDYARAWVAERTDACRATHVRGEQSQARLDERNACLDTRLREFATRVATLREVTASNLASTPRLFDQLVAPAACGSRAALAHESAPPAAGLVSTFDDGTLAAQFGMGWSVSTDGIMGGKSRAALHAARGAMAVTGTVEQADSPIAWAGAMFYPGKAPMAPVDLSARHYIAFSARGDGGTYEVLLFSATKGDLPAFRPFEAGARWKTYRFPLADFDAVNPADITGLLFASNRSGKFAFELDDVRFE
jgi:eukaryotic-like serine/threonine-protein kinase